MPDWRRNLAVMVLVQFMMTIAQSNTAPFLPLFIQELGLSDLALAAAWSGIIFATTPLVAALASPFWGTLADLRGRKPMVLRSALGVGVFMLLMTFTRNIWQLFALRVAMGLFSGFSPTAVTLMASTAPPDKVGFSLGWLQTGQLLGSMVGPIFGGLLADALGTYREVFRITGLLCLAVALVVQVLVREDFQPRAAETGPKPSALNGVGAVLANGAIMTMFVVLFLAQFATRTVEPVVSLFVQTLVPDSNRLSTLAGLVFVVTGIAGLIAAPFLGRRSDQLGYRRVLLVCLLGTAAVFVPQAFTGDIRQFLFLRFLLGLFVGSILPTANALIARLTPPEQRGQVFGVTSSAFFLGNFAGPLTGGFLSAWLGIRAVFLLTAAVLAVNTLWVVFLVREPQPAEAARETVPVDQTSSSRA